MALNRNDKFLILGAAALALLVVAGLAVWKKPHLFGLAPAPQASAPAPATAEAGPQLPAPAASAPVVQATPIAPPAPPSQPVAPAPAAAPAQAIAPVPAGQQGQSQAASQVETPQPSPAKPAANPSLDKLFAEIGKAPDDKAQAAPSVNLPSLQAEAKAEPGKVIEAPQPEKPALAPDKPAPEKPAAPAPEVQEKPGKGKKGKDKKKPEPQAAPSAQPAAPAQAPPAAAQAAPPAAQAAPSAAVAQPAPPTSTQAAAPQPAPSAPAQAAPQVTQTPPVAAAQAPQPEAKPAPAAAPAPPAAQAAVAQPAKAPAAAKPAAPAPAKLSQAPSPSVSPFAQAAGGSLKGVTTQDNPTDYQIRLRTVGKIGDYSCSFMDSPPRLVVDIPGQWKNSGPGSVKGQGMVRDIRIGEHPDRLRLVLDLGVDSLSKLGGMPTVEKTNEGLSIRLKK